MWTIQANGSYAQTYPNPYPTVTSITISPSTITAGNTATITVSLSSPTPSGTLVNIRSTNGAVFHGVYFYTAPNTSSFTYDVTAASGTSDYTTVTIDASVAQNSTTDPSATVTVYTPGGIVTGGGGTGGGGGGTGGGGTGGGGTGGGGTGTGTGGGGTGTGGGSGGSGGGASYGHYEVDHYSGGTIATQDVSGAHTASPTSSSYGYDGSARVQGDSSSSNSTYISARIQGPVTTTFRWITDPAYPNSPPPAQAIVTETCSYNWQLYDPDSGISGSFNTDLGQTGPIAANTNSSGGGSKTFSVSTGGNSSFTVSSNPLGSFAGYLKYGCSYETLGFHFTAAAIAPTVLSLRVNQDQQVFAPAATTRFSATVSSPTSITVDSMIISVDGTPITATISAGSLTGYIDWPSASAANPSEHTVTATAQVHDGATSLSLDSTQPQGNGRPADNIIADVRLQSLDYDNAYKLRNFASANPAPNPDPAFVPEPQFTWTQSGNAGSAFGSAAGDVQGRSALFSLGLYPLTGTGVTLGFKMKVQATPNTVNAQGQADSPLTLYDNSNADPVNTLTTGSTAATVGGKKAAALSVPVLKQAGQPVMTLDDLLRLTGGKITGHSGNNVQVKS